MEIYLDNSATTRVFPEVAEKMTEVMCESYGNPSSMHHKGVEAEMLLRKAKETLAGILKCDTRNIYFTSGGTESDNMAIIGAAKAMARLGTHLITSEIEHPAVLNTMKHLEEEGFRVTRIPVDARGVLRLDLLEEAVDASTTVVSIMHTNNEIGAVQPIAEIAEIIKKKNPNALLHVDAVQGFGKAVIQPKKLGIDMLSISSHKIHGPKGMGALYVGDRVRLLPINYGGGQQNGLRSGTENVPGIVGMSLAAKMLYDAFDKDIAKLYSLKKRLIKGALQIDGVVVNGMNTESGHLKAEDFATLWNKCEDGSNRQDSDNKLDSRSQQDSSSQQDCSQAGDEISTAIDAATQSTAPHIVSLSFPGIRAEVLLHTLENEGIYVSAGSACSTHKPEPSATLKAIGIAKEYLDTTLRFSMSVFTTEEDIDMTLQVLKKQLPILQKYVRH